MICALTGLALMVGLQPPLQSAAAVTALVLGVVGWSELTCPAGQGPATARPMIVARRLSRDRTPQAVAERTVSRDFGSFHDERAGRIRVRAARIDNAGRGAGARRENSRRSLRLLILSCTDRRSVVKSEGAQQTSAAGRRPRPRPIAFPYRDPPGASGAPRQSQSLPRTGLAA